jgi:hypothetical protein
MVCVGLGSWSVVRWAVLLVALLKQDLASRLSGLLCS